VLVADPVGEGNRHGVGFGIEVINTRGAGAVRRSANGARVIELLCDSSANASIIKRAQDRSSKGDLVGPGASFCGDLFPLGPQDRTDRLLVALGVGHCVLHASNISKLEPIVKKKGGYLKIASAVGSLLGEDFIFDADHIGRACSLRACVGFDDVKDLAGIFGDARPTPPGTQAIAELLVGQFIPTQEPLGELAVHVRVTRLEPAEVEVVRRIRRLFGFRLALKQADDGACGPLLIGRQLRADEIFSVGGVGRGSGHCVLHVSIFSQLETDVKTF